MRTSIKNTIIILLLGVIALVALYHSVDVKAAFYTVKEDFARQREADEAKHADLLLRVKFKELESLIAQYEQEYVTQKVQIAVSRAEVQKREESLAQREKLANDFAALVVQSPDDTIIYYGRIYTEDAARAQLKQYVVEMKEMREAIEVIKEKIQQDSVQIDALGMAIAQLKQEKIASEMRAKQLVSERELAKIEQIILELSGSPLGEGSSTIATTSREIKRILDVLEKDVMKTSLTARLTQATDGQYGGLIMGFHETEALQRRSEKEEALENEIDHLLASIRGRE